MRRGRVAERPGSSRRGSSVPAAAARGSPPSRRGCDAPGGRRTPARRPRTGCRPRRSRRRHCAARRAGRRSRPGWRAHGRDRAWRRARASGGSRRRRSRALRRQRPDRVHNTARCRRAASCNDSEPSRSTSSRWANAAAIVDPRASTPASAKWASASASASPTCWAAAIRGMERRSSQIDLAEQASGPPEDRQRPADAEMVALRATSIGDRGRLDGNARRIALDRCGELGELGEPVRCDPWFGDRPDDTT